MSRLQHLPILAVFFVFCCGCLPRFTHEVSPADASIPGIAPKDGEPQHVDLIFVHGMGGYSDGDPEYMIDEIARRLELDHQPREDDEYSLAVGGCRCPELVQDLYVSPETGFELHTHVIKWSCITHAHTKRLENEDESPGRVPFNHWIKDELVNDGGGDVMLYMSSKAPEMRRPIRASLRQIFSEKDVDGPVVLVSFSLGSLMVFDTIEEMREGKGIGAARDDDLLMLRKGEHERQPSGDPVSQQEAAAKLASRHTTMFMLSNQIPLLLLSRTAGPGEVSAVAEVEQLMDRQEANFGDLTLVAVSDPNDLLSYPLPDRHHPDNVAVVNVTTAVDEWSALGVLVNPVEAHQGYGQDSKVIDLIINGRRPDP